ncbi:MAG: DUF2461 domain-containing protein [Pseudomonadota bacterium]
MADGFEALIGEANAFFAELKKNNSKDWFEPRKGHYTDRIKKPAELLADVMGDELGRITGSSFKPKLFRIYRDVRFSKDKTPYNTHLHLSWFPPEGEARPGWFFGSAPDYLLLGCGVPGLKGADLTQFRAAIDRDGAALQASLTEAGRTCGAELSGWGAEPLKRVPKPYDEGHPSAELLKRKSLVLHADLPQDWAKAGLIAALRARAEAMLPVWRWLDEAMRTAMV